MSKKTRRTIFTITLSILILFSQSFTVVIRNDWRTNVEHVLSSSGDGRPFGHNGHGPKIGRLWQLFSEGGRAGSQSNIM